MHIKHARILLFIFFYRLHHISLVFVFTFAIISSITLIKNYMNFHILCTRRFYLFFSFFFYRSSSALYCWSATQILLGSHWATFCVYVCVWGGGGGGLPMSICFVSGSSGYRNHDRMVTMWTPYCHSILTYCSFLAMAHLTIS